MTARTSSDSQPRYSREAKLTHGRHCRCSACARQDWSEPQLAPCGMHGESCPPVYDPIDAWLGSVIRVDGSVAVDARVELDGKVMDVHGCVIRALFDPGIFLRRGEGYDEALHRWQARAVMEALKIAGHEITEVPGCRVTPERNYA